MPLRTHDNRKSRTDIGEQTRNFARRMTAAEIGAATEFYANRWPTATSRPGSSVDGSLGLLHICCGCR
jgi:hypothetical protein